MMRMYSEIRERLTALRDLIYSLLQGNRLVLELCTLDHNNAKSARLYIVVTLCISLPGAAVL